MSRFSVADDDAVNLMQIRVRMSRRASRLW